MMRVAAMALGLALAVQALTGPALAADRPPLQDEPHIRASLIAGRVADVLRNECGSLHGRVVLALSKLNDLKGYALSKGYTEAEVKAFLKSKAQKDAMKAAAAEYLAKAGAVAGDEASYCRVGRDEIAKGTLAGSLLWSW